MDGKLIIVFYIITHAFGGLYIYVCEIQKVWGCHRFSWALSSVGTSYQLPGQLNIYNSMCFSVMWDL